MKRTRDWRRHQWIVKKERALAQEKSIPWMQIAPKGPGIATVLKRRYAKGVRAVGKAEVRDVKPRKAALQGTKKTILWDLW